MRLEWKVKRSSELVRARRANISGSSVSMVVFELGTIKPSRVGFIGVRLLVDSGRLLARGSRNLLGAWKPAPSMIRTIIYWMPFAVKRSYPQATEDLQVHAISTKSSVRAGLSNVSER